MRAKLTALARHLARGVAECGRELALRWRVVPPPVAVREVPPPVPPLAPLARVRLAAGVNETLFAEFAAHRATDRGAEETGWLLLGVRERDEAIALATLPAGAGREAGVAHVLFNRDAQAVASRMVRQGDRRLLPIGVVHTHPGSMRHPSDGDYRGDVQWVRGRRGRDGVFGIGTADADPATPGERSPQANRRCRGELCLSWYALGADDSRYRPLPVADAAGDDAAAKLRPLWPVLEEQAARLDRIARQQAGVRFDALPDGGLLVTVPLAGPADAVKIVATAKAVRYFVEQGGQLLAADLRESRLDHGLYQLMAELAPPVTVE